jgi:RNA polymerase sigma factor (sigma-70 family)
MALTLSKISRSPAHGESDLVAAAREGDDRAFEQLYARYRDRIFSFILSKVHDHGRAEDIAQEVFISALRRLRESEQRISFKPWIYEIAKNACIDEFRRGNRSREVPLETDGEFVTDRESTLSIVPTPAAAVESKQRLDDLRGAFGGLSSTHHQLLVMREFEGLSYEEIGDRLGMTRQMVESGLFRARRKLTEEYEELTSGRRCQQVQGEIETGAMQSIRSLGLKQRRRVARHLSHCQPCRHVALMAGVDEALLKPRSISEKIAALLPFPLFRWVWPWRGGRGRHGAGASSSGSHHLATAGSVPKAAGLAQSAGSSISLGQAATAAAVLALAGAGGGLVHGLSGGSSHRPAALIRSADRGASAHPGTAASSGTGASSTTAAPSAAASGTAARLLPGATSALTISAPASAGRPARGGHHGAGSAPGAPGSGSGSTGSGPVASAGGAGGTVGSGIGSTLGGAGKDLGLTAGVVKSTVTSATNGVNGAVKTATNGLTGAVKTATNGLTGAVKNATNGVKSTVAGTTKQVGSVVHQVAATAGGAVAGVTGSAAGSGATAPVKSVVPVLGNTLSAVTGSTPAGSGSPSGATAKPAPGTSPAAGAVAGVTQPLKSAVGKVTSGLLGK